MKKPDNERVERSAGYHGYGGNGKGASQGTRFGPLTDLRQILKFTIEVK